MNWYNHDLPTKKEQGYFDVCEYEYNGVLISTRYNVYTTGYMFTCVCTAGNNCFCAWVMKFV